MELGLRDKCVVITGGARGIGKALALRYLEEGCKVAVCGRTGEVLDRFAAECAAAGHGEALLARRADVTDSMAMRDFADEALRRFGALHIWVNNAGVVRRGPLLKATPEEWDRMMDVNLRAVWQCSKLAAERMPGGGVIANASSYAGVIPKAGSGVYAVSKWGVNCLTRCLAAELAPMGIRIFGYMPGVIATEMTEALLHNRANLEKEVAMRRLGVPEDIAPTVVFLSSPLAGYVTGVNIEISGGKFCIQNPQAVWDQQ